MSTFVHLHNHSSFSFLDGATQIDPLVARVAELGMGAVALTDHGNMHGAAELYKAAGKAGIKAVAGCEIYLIDGDHRSRDPKLRYTHLILLAETQEGYQNLCRLVSAGYLEGFYRKPRVSYDLLETHNGGLIALSACIRGPLNDLLVADRYEEALAVGRRLATIFGPRDALRPTETARFYLELQDHGIGLQRKCNEGLRRIAAELGLPLVVTNDSHYLCQDDYRPHDALLCIQGGEFYDPTRTTVYNREFWIKGPLDMALTFPLDGEALGHTGSIADRCEVSLKARSFHMPRFRLDVDEGEELAGMARQGLADRLRTHIGRTLPADPELAAQRVREYWTRLDFELVQIRQMGFAGYLLIVQDYINWAKTNGIPTGPGRGSAAGSLVCYSVGITDIDPIQYGLYFERFLNPGRCFPGWSRVETRRGWIPIEDVVPFEDEAWTRVGWKTIIRKMSRQIDEDICFLVIGHHDGSITVTLPTQNHKIYMAKGESCEQKEAVHISRGESVCTGRHNLHGLPEDFRGLQMSRKTRNMLKRLQTLRAWRQAQETGTSESKKGACPSCNKAVPDVSDRIQWKCQSAKMQYVPKKKSGSSSPEEMSYLYQNIPCAAEKQDVFEEVRKGTWGHRGLFVWTQRIQARYRHAGQVGTRSRFRSCSTGAWSYGDVRTDHIHHRRRPGISARFSLTRDGGVLRAEGVDSESVNLRSELQSSSRYWQPDHHDDTAGIPGVGQNGSASSGNRLRVDPGSIRGFQDGKSFMQGLWEDVRETYHSTKRGLQPELREQDSQAGSRCRSATILDTQTVHFTGLVWDIEVAECHEYNCEGVVVSNSTSPPDIDADFGQAGREAVMEYVRGRHGGDARVAQIVTYQRLHPRNLIRDLGRVMGIPLVETDRAAKLVPDEVGVTLAGALDAEPRLRELPGQDPRWGELLAYAARLEGVARNTSVHAAGVIISPVDLTDVAPLYRATGKGPLALQYDMKGAEQVGLIKFDFLGLKTLDAIRRTCDLLGGLDILSIPTDDARTFELLRRGETAGVFQVEEKGITDLTVRMQPDRIEHLFAIVALYRPGPLESGMVEDYVERRAGRREITHEIPELADILQTTYGVICYQEQVMAIAARLAGFDLTTADNLRRAMGKKDAKEMASLESKFLEGCGKNGLNVIKCKELFDKIQLFAGYSFNLAHAAAYGTITYQTAYLKANHPAAFWAGLMTVDAGNSDKLAEYVGAARRAGCQVLVPDVNRSEGAFAVDGEAVRYGLAAVKGVGEGAVEAILEARARVGPLQTLQALCDAVDLRRANAKVLGALCQAGALDGLGGRTAVLAGLEGAIKAGQAWQREERGVQASLFGREAVRRRVELPVVQAWPLLQALEAEREALGFYFSGHPLDAYRDLLVPMGVIGMDGLARVRNEGQVVLAGLVRARRVITTKRGDRMAFATVADDLGEVEVVVFADAYRAAADLLAESHQGPVLIRGRVQERNGTRQVVADQVQDLDAALLAWPGGLDLNLPDGLPIDVLREVEQALLRVPGACQVRLIRAGQPLPVSYRAAPSADLLAGLRRLVPDLNLQAASSQQPRSGNGGALPFRAKRRI